MSDKFAGNKVDWVIADEMFGNESYDFSELAKRTIQKHIGNKLGDWNKTKALETAIKGRSDEVADRRMDYMSEELEFIHTAINNISEDCRFAQDSVNEVREYMQAMDQDFSEVRAIAGIATDADKMLSKAAERVQDKLDKKINDFTERMLFAVEQITLRIEKFEQRTNERLDEMAQRIELVNSDFGRF